MASKFKMPKIVYETNSHILMLQSLVICRFIGTQEFIYCGYNLITSRKDSKTFNPTVRDLFAVSCTQPDTVIDSDPPETVAVRGGPAVAS